MKINTKLCISLGTILIASGLAFNFAIRNILTEKMETTLEESITQIMNSVSESVKYRISSNLAETTDEKLSNEANYLLNYISLNTGCNIQIRNNSNNILSDNTNSIFKDEIDTLNNSSQNNNLIMSIKYANSSVYAILSYPIYYDSQKIGTVTIEHEYKSIYENNLETLNTLTIIEIIIFILIFLTAFIIIFNIVKPITLLTNGVKQIKDGNFNFSLNTKSNDEIGILSKEFINMKDTISTQMQTIKEEKNKVIELEKHRKEFFDNVTHELKTPLTGIIGYSEILLDDMVEDEDFKKRALLRINKESERIHQLVLDLISVSKGQNYSDEDKVKLSMKPLINEIIDDMSIKGNKYDLCFDKTIEDGFILGRENKIREVIINIIDNAIKYSYNSKTIEITAKANDDIYIITVKNGSKPIPDNIYSSIFDPFIKSNSSVDKYSSGLGLYICKEIINDHEGEIKIENGETVTVTIKLKLIRGEINEKNP